MSEPRRSREPTPHLHTRPATMLTAIGLCVLIVVMQLVPQFQDTHAQAAPSTMGSNVR